jgi:hypothetical protein
VTAAPPPADDRPACRVERLTSGSWAVTFPDGLASFYSTEGQARRAAERWRATGRRIDGYTRAGEVPGGDEGPEGG